MTAITFNTAPRVAAVASKLQSFFSMLRDAVDAFAVYRMQHAVPESELRRIEHDIDRYRLLMRKGADARIVR
jgi:hypothetical protein